MKSFDAVVKNASSLNSVVWGKQINGNKAIGAVAFAALVVACSITVGCSGDKPKPASISSQIPMMPPQTVASNPTISVAEVAKPAKKKVQKKRPTTKIYADKTYGVSFEYPRKYEMESGGKANDLLASGAAPAVQGGEVLAAVSMPETLFPNTDFAGAFFGVSVNKDLTAEQCGEFGGKKTSAPTPAASTAVEVTPEVSSVSQPAIEDQGKRVVGDSELHATETVTGNGARQSDAKYFRTFQNGACYQFSLNVTTVGNDDASMKHVDRDRVFNRLEKILATVKIAPSVVEPAPAVQTTASIPSAPTTETPAQ